MTRETKIGLLVGLAFIIVIGILLSDHLTQTNEPQQAPLTQVASNVRTGVAVPGASATTPPPQAVTPPTGTVAPRSPVPTQDELAPAKPPVEVIQVGGDAAKTGTSGGNTAKPQATAPQAQERGVTGIDSNSTIVARPVEPVNGSLSTVAKSFGEEVVPANGGSSNTSTVTPTKPQNTTTLTSTAGMKQYTAVAGDSVYRIASKMMGSGSKANRDALIAANPSLQQNANMVIAGKIYNVPSSATSTSSTSTPTPAPSAPAPAPSRIAIVADKPPTGSEPTGNVYTVKAGDSLTKIAVEQCGTAGAVNAIMDLNKDLLKGGTTIRPNMKLRLPGKPVASAE